METLLIYAKYIAISIAIALVLGAIGVALLIFSVWIDERLERCPNCQRRGGLRMGNSWLDTRANAEGVRYPGWHDVRACQHCGVLILRDSETGTRCVSPDDEAEWRKSQE